jgi:AcrR family transcriptional regulator
MIVTIMLAPWQSMSVEPEPRSRRERPAKPALTRAGIVSAAVEVMRAEGLERVTLRRLAQELDTGPASVYVYFRNVAALRAAIFEEVLETVVLPARDEPGRWASCVIEALWSYSQLLVAHPSLARSALSSRPSGSNYLSFVDYLLGALEDGGVPSGQRAWGVDVLLLFATALAAEHSERRRSSQKPRDHLELAFTIRNITPALYPAIAAIGEELLMSGSTRARYEWGVRVLLAGFAVTPIPNDLQPADAEGEDL